MATKKLLERVISGGVWLGSKTASKIALPSAVFSTMHDGSYIGRGLRGVKTTYDVLESVIGAYVDNSGIRDLVNGLSLEVIKAAGNAAENLQEDPERTLYTALGTFLVLKSLDVARKSIRGYSRLKMSKKQGEYSR